MAGPADPAVEEVSEMDGLEASLHISSVRPSTTGETGVALGLGLEPLTLTHPSDESRSTTTTY